VRGSARARLAALDADVLHALPLRDTLLTIASPPHELFAPRWSERVLAEVERSLARRIGLTAAAVAVEAMRIAFPDVAVDVSNALVDGMPNHPKDRHVLAVAVQSRAPILVTRNVRDFAGAEKVGVSVQHPDTFLCALLDAEPETVAAALADQAAALSRPPMTVAAVLTRFDRLGLRRFAARLSER
jgi:hypothetical protein